MAKEETFQHRISKGSRYNQIYIPREMEQIFEIGDIVEVRLVKKKQELFYSENLKKLGKIGKFKEVIIREVFSVLAEFKDIEQIILFGSFLFEKVDYHDLDIAILTKKEKLDEEVYNTLIDGLPFKFHIISFEKENFRELLEFCPLTRSMFYYFISNKKLEIPEKTEINKEHLEFLLMMPEDLLKIKVSNSKLYFDSIRKLITIIRFLEKQELNPVKINLELKSLLGELYGWSRNNESLNEESYKKLKSLISIKLKEARSLLNE